ncbi:MAG TPA: RNA polymerase sigma factor [Lacunisphaera sp.]|nr:RNA polymerase sigma factor [Lacunisphaera sp.]
MEPSIQPSPPAAPAPDPDQSRWFSDEVQPHEEALRAYLQARFAGLGEVDDIVQETYARMLRAHGAGVIRSTKSLLFTTARNAALDAFRRRRVRPAEPLAPEHADRGPADTPDARESVSHRQELDLLAEAMAALPPQCREVMLRRYRDGAPCREIAAQLQLSPETIKVHLARGLRRCTDYFAERGLLKGRVAVSHTAS